VTQQEMIDRDLRLLLGDLQLQLVFAKARIAELEQTVASRPNGDGRHIDQRNEPSPPPRN
jgi:hypothetical protein